MAITIETKDNELVSFDLLTFSGGERHVQLGSLPDSDGYTLRCQVLNSQDLMDLLLVCNALSHAAPEAALQLELPYLPYARQDRVCAPGQAFSLEVLAKLLRSVPNLKELIVWDCHSSVGLELTGAKNVEAHEIIRSCDVLMSVLHRPDSILISPDKGAIARTERAAEAFGGLAVAYASKVRDPKTGYITDTHIDAETLAGKTAIISDDICDGGMTFIKLAEALKRKGAERVLLYVTHGIFSKGLGVFDGLIDEIYTTTSLPNEPAQGLTIIPYQHDFQAETDPCV